MDAAAIEAKARRLYGDVDWRRARGCLHVAAIHGASHRVIAIGPAAPASPTDRLVLGFARARACVIVTTGSILRAEPDLVHRYAEEDDAQEAFAAWRAETLGLSAPPRLLVLSGSGRFPLDHPALEGAQGWIWTTPAGLDHLAGGAEGLERVSRSEASVADALAFVARDPAVSTLLVEAGPSTTGPLYAEGGAGSIDELLLSRFEGELAGEAEGPPFVPAARLAARFGDPVSQATLEEASGPWRFERFLSREADRA